MSRHDPDSSTGVDPVEALVPRSPRRLSRVLRIIVSLLLLGIALWILDWNELKAALLAVSPWLFGLATLLSFLQFAVLGMRWHELVRRVAPLPRWTHLRWYFHATFLNTFAPANVAGDVYRFVSIKAHATNALTLLFTLLRERIIGLLGCFLFVLICLAFVWWWRPDGFERVRGMLPPLAGLLVLGVVSILVAPRVLALAGRLRLVRTRAWLASPITKLQVATGYDSPREFGILIGLTLVGLGVRLVTVRLVAYDLDIRISWAALGALIVLVEIARAIPISVQGIGVREGAYAYLFALLGHSSESGFALATISYVVLNCSFLVSGGVAWLMMSRSETSMTSASTGVEEVPGTNPDSHSLEFRKES